MHGTRQLLLGMFFFIASGVGRLPAQPDASRLLEEMRWRCIGPANFAGRIVDVEAVESDFTHVVVASASGGVWQSKNAGVTWEPIFDHYGSASIGDIKIFQKNPDILWVGTGEANNRNSVAWGDGIYKSTDGDKTFRNMGLRDTYQIARIVTHPDDPEIVYVAAIGNLWRYTGDRGLFKTTDGGESWHKLTNGLPDDGRTGAIDLVMDPSDPNTLFVAFYQRLRKPYRFDSGGPNGGIFKSTDAGETWRKLTRGLPEGPTGRIGLDIYRKNPKILMAIIEHGYQPQMYEEGYDDMSRPGTGIYRSEDGGETWQFLNRYNNRPFYYSQIRINPLDDQRVYVLTTTIRLSEDGGHTFVPGGLSFEGGLDYHAMWLDPTDADRYYLGKDKGLTLTHDHGKTFQLFDNMPVGQFYAIGVDMRDPYYVYGGTQDNGTWGGPSFSKDARGILADSWWKLHWGDGMFIQIDPTDWRKAYTEAENGSFRRYDVATRRVEFARPNPRNIINLSEYVQVPQPGKPRAAPATGSELEARIAMARYAEVLRDKFRFNWRAPLVMSHHNPGVLYLGGNHLFKTVDGGDHWRIASPDLSTQDKEKTRRDSGGLTRDVTGAETHCTITAFSESPINPQILWAGTDDGNVQVTRDGGVTWQNVRNNIPDVPQEIWVSHVEASHFDPAVCYVTFDGHRSADFSPWVFKTSDFGATWTNISGNIPAGHAMYVIREDVKNKNLLFAGSEFACFISLDGGESWQRFMNNLPTVAIHDLVIHPRDGDLIAGTHGRSLWIADDITPLQQLTDEIMQQEAHLFRNRPMTLWNDASRGGVRGHFFFAGENPPYIPKREDVVRAKLISGGLINYYLKSRARDVSFEIADIGGTRKATLSGDTTPGIHRVLWDLRFDPTPAQQQNFTRQLQRALDGILKLPRLARAEKAWLASLQKEFNRAKTLAAQEAVRAKLVEHFRDVRSMRRFFVRPLRGALATPGVYRLTMTVDGKQYTGTIEVRPDPML